MNIAIIGSGNVGSALGSSLVSAGHRVTVTARDSVKATTVAAQIGASVVPSALAAAEAADVIVLAIPYGAVESVAKEIAAAVSGKVVIDTTNPLKADYSGLATDGGPSGAERIAAQLPGARVVKAFNTLFASIQADTAVHGQTVDGLIAADDADAKTTVAELRELESLAWLNIALQLRTGGSWKSSFVLIGAPDKAIAA
ncbi:MAG: oxidoreductase coenzyme F420-dependent [Chloroflexi bacterium]|nr:oxidoreductase coenzyme F420-dependent [Chloroflexota bacterium]